MKSKKVLLVAFALVLTMCLVAGCGSSNSGEKQTASAWQTVGDGDKQAVMTVDLTGGYSVEFATGAAYFYKGEPSDDNEVLAFGYVITEKEYNDEVSYFQNNDEYKDALQDLGDGVYCYSEETGAQYFMPAEDGFYLKIAVQEAGMDEADSIYPRFSADSGE